MSEHEVSGLQDKPNDHITSVSCSCGWKYEGTSRWLALLAGDGHQHAAANATIEAQPLVLSQYRENIVQEWRAHLNRRGGKFVCGWYECSQEAVEWDQIRHTDDCRWAILNLPHPAAVEQAAAVLKAGDEMAVMIERCEWAITTESHGALTDSKNAYRRARAALRVHGAAEG